MSKQENVVQKKLFSIVLVWVAFVILYFLLKSGNETMTWVGLGLMAVASGVLYLNN